MFESLIKRSAPLRVLRTSAVAGVLLLSNLTVAQADVTPQNVNVFQHFSDCLHALLSNSAEHKQFCTPGLTLNGGSLSSGGGGKSENCPVTGMIAPSNLAFGEKLLVATRYCYKPCASMVTTPIDLVVGDRVEFACV